MAASTEPDRTIHSASQPASCCSAFYELDWVRRLAEDIFHPGGAELTNRTVAAMNLPPGAAVADLGCGTGTTAMMLDRYYGFRVSAVDISAANIERAMPPGPQSRLYKNQRANRCRDPDPALWRCAEPQHPFPYAVSCQRFAAACFLYRSATRHTWHHINCSLRRNIGLTD